MNLLLAVLFIIIGAGIACAGLPLYLILLPVSGFMVGFLLGAAGVASMLGDGFLATTVGILGGLLIGAIFAVASYAYWYIGVLLAVAMAGFVFGAALFGAIGITSDWLLFMLGFAAAVLFFVLAWVVNLPAYMVIIGTALTGSAFAIGGLLVLLGQIEPSAIGTGEAWRAIQGNLLLWVLWAVAAAAGATVQWSTMTGVQLPADKWGTANRKDA